MKPTNPTIAAELKKLIDLKCIVCEEDFNDSQREPMIICCNQHYYCKQCIKDMLNKKQEQPQTQMDKCHCGAKMTKSKIKPYRLIKDCLQVCNKSYSQKGNQEINIKMEALRLKTEEFSLKNEELTKLILQKLIPKIDNLQKQNKTQKQELEIKINKLSRQLTIKTEENINIQIKNKKQLKEMKIIFQKMNFKHIQSQYIDVLSYSNQIIDKMSNECFDCSTDISQVEAKLKNLSFPFQIIQLSEQKPKKRQSNSKYFNVKQNYPIIMEKINHFQQKEEFIKCINIQKLNKEITQTINKETIKQAILREIHATLNSLFQQMKFFLDFPSFQDHLRNKNIFYSSNVLQIVLLTKSQKIKLREKYFKKEQLQKIIDKQLFRSEMKSINAIQKQQDRKNRISPCLLKLIKWKLIQNEISDKLLQNYVQDEFCIAASEYLNKDLSALGYQMKCSNWYNYINKPQSNQTIEIRLIQQLKVYPSFAKIQSIIRQLKYLTVLNIQTCKDTEFDSDNCVSFGKRMEEISSINHSQLQKNKSYFTEESLNLLKKLKQQKSLFRLFQAMDEIVKNNKGPLYKQNMKQLQNRIELINQIGFELTADMVAYVHTLAIYRINQLSSKLNNQNVGSLII